MYKNVKQFRTGFTWISETIYNFPNFFDKFFKLNTSSLLSFYTCSNFVVC